MIGGLIRFVVLRVLGARVLLVLAILGWIRNRLRRTTPDESLRESRRPDRLAR
jgi:hypothetical protein